ncbi:MAG: hypothetical protein UGF89_08755 [Acutalibacteraceae bacterium]|nr:hypothetical protein [Acutalibacteraceae bacterium]
MAKENFVNGINFDNLTEQELRELNKASQEKLDAINAEKRRKAELKKNYALKEVPSTFKLDQARLGRSVVMWFKDHQEPLDSGTFNALVEGCTDEIKPKREEVYPCPLCGEFSLRVGNFGDTFAPRIAVTCDNCEFVMKKKTDGKEYYAWEVFHEWLVKHGYLSEDVKFDY